MAWPAAGYFTSSITNLLAKQAQDAWLAMCRLMPGAAGSISTLTINAGAVVPTAARHKIDTEASASTDDLDALTQTNFPDDGMLITLSTVSNARDVQLRHAQGGAGQFILATAANFTLSDTTMTITLEKVGATWVEVSRFLGATMIATASNPGYVAGLASNSDATTGTETTKPIVSSVLAAWWTAIKAAALSFTGLVTFTTSKNVEQTLTDATTIAWNVANGDVAKVTIGASRTMGAPTNLQTGGFYFLTIRASGSFTISSWNSVFDFGTAGAPTLTATNAKEDKLSFYYNGTKLQCIGIAKGFS